MNFTGFNDGDPPSQSYDVDDGLSISVVDSAFGEVKVKAFLNRDRVNKFFYIESISYGRNQDDADKSTKHKHAETLLENALTYQQDIEQQVRQLRDKVEQRVNRDVEVSPVRTNRESELHNSKQDDSVYAFHVTARHRNRTNRVYVGDNSLRTESKAPFQFVVRGENEATGKTVSEGQVVSKIEGQIRAWEDSF